VSTKFFDLEFEGLGGDENLLFAVKGSRFTEELSLESLKFLGEFRHIHFDILFAGESYSQMFRYKFVPRY